MKKTKSSTAKASPAVPTEAARASETAPAGKSAKAARTPKAPLPGALPPEAQLVEEGELDHDVLEFVNAIDTYKRTRGRQFPAWSEVLDVLKSLGYRKGG